MHNYPDRSSSVDHVQIQGFKLRDSTNEDGPDLSVSVRAKTNFAVAAATDDVKHALDYREIVNCLRNIQYEPATGSHPHSISKVVFDHIATLSPPVSDAQVDITSHPAATNVRPSGEPHFGSNFSLSQSLVFLRGQGRRTLHSRLSFSLDDVPIIVGVLPHERSTKQPVKLEIALESDRQGSIEKSTANGHDPRILQPKNGEGLSLDNFEDHIRSLKAFAIDWLEGTSFYTVETLVYSLAAEIQAYLRDSLQIDHRDSVTVTVGKPEAFKDCESAGVSVTRKCSPSAHVSKTGEAHKVYLGLGSNLGDRVAAIERALTEMRARGLRVKRTSSLWETEAMYVKDQAPFLNGVCEIETHLSPLDLLDCLQSVEKDMGRRKTVDKGPRNIDLDILLYNDDHVDHPRLKIPHALMSEREFVLRPLCELVPDTRLPNSPAYLTFRELLKALPRAKSPMSKSMPLTRNGTTQQQTLYRHQTYLMAVLNLTPDSFSDGGEISCADTETIMSTVSSFLDSGATIIDVGGQSTRPGAEEVGPAEELNRILPAIKALKAATRTSNACISVDTFNADVANAALDAGADMINDVSGGLMDDQMFPLVASKGCTICIMHMRGTPTTMNKLTDYPDGVLPTVSRELASRVAAAEEAGIPWWRIMIDPGIGFAKTQSQNLELLRHLSAVRNAPGLQGLPCLVGASRKGFIGRITETADARERTWGTAAAVTAAVAGGADVVRVHDVPQMKQVVRMADAMYR